MTAKVTIDGQTSSPVGQALAAALAHTGDQPATVLVSDCNSKGAIFTRVENRWIGYDLDYKEALGEFGPLAVVTLDESLLTGDLATLALPSESGLAQASLAVDLDSPHGEYVVLASSLDELDEIYGDALIILWQEPTRRRAR